ncbi:hypothetical protein D3C87_1747030 [compost metagenome]
MEQGLAAREDEGRDSEGPKIAHDREDLVGLELARKGTVGGDGVAVLTGEVAAPGEVPDHHRPGWVALGAQGRRVQQLSDGLRYAEHGASFQAFRRRPVFLRIRVL